MALEALKQIAEIGHFEVSQDNEQEEIIPKTKWLFFFIGKEKYAVCENQVLYILNDVKLYNFPFAPQFIDGIINNHNKICTVVNYKKLINDFSSDLEMNLYIVLKTDTDDIALRVSRIDDFYQVPDEAYSLVKTIDQENEDCKFIVGNLNYEEEIIPVINIQTINDVIIGSCNKEVH